MMPDGQTVEIWACPQPDCDYRINRPATPLQVEAADRRALSRMIAEHVGRAHTAAHELDQ